MTTPTEQERVKFRLFHMPCCGQMLCWVNPRLPTHCPECGRNVYVQLRSGAHTLLDDDEAVLTTHPPVGVHVPGPPPHFAGYRLCHLCNGSHFTRDHDRVLAAESGLIVNGAVDIPGDTPYVADRWEPNG